jgi:tetratricopeptide (TPR) repeat protein
MAGKRKPNSPLLCVLLCATLFAASALGQTVRHHQEKIETDAASAAVTQAEAAIEKQDFATAEKLLLPVVAANPKDATAWYDLGYVYKATQRRELAVDAYRKSVVAKPSVYEPNLNLALLLAQKNEFDEAAKHMGAALKLMPSSASGETKSKNWIALGEMKQSLDTQGAIAAFRQAAIFAPKNPEPHLLIAKTLRSSKDISGAEAEYRQALALDPQSKEALAGLADISHGSNDGTEIVRLREYLQSTPNDAYAHRRLGQLLLKSGDVDGAMAEFNEGLKSAPEDKALLHEVAAAYATQKRFDLAEPQYAELVRIAPENAQYQYQYGSVLLQLHKFPEAQEHLLQALKLDGKLLDAYGELAIAASENKQYPLTINVLDARGKLTTETPATLFLRATAYDNLKAFSQAAENYHKFLEASKGQFPDNEWKARHRLIAIEPLAGKKKK